MFGPLMGALAGVPNGGGGITTPLAQQLLNRALPQQAQGTPQGVPFQDNVPGPAQGMWSKTAAPQQKQQQPPQQQGPLGPPPAPPPPMQGVGGMPTQPPNPQGHLPPAQQRWANGQQIQQAYANNWQPNPVLLRAMQSR